MILVINAGSSSLKFAIVDPLTGDQPLTGVAERLGTAQATIAIKRNGTKIEETLTEIDHAGALRRLDRELVHSGLATRITGIGHRVVHGGPDFTGSRRIDAAVLAGIEALVPLAPLHNPPALVGLRACAAVYPELPQVAVFDTAFHQTMPEKAWRYPVPEDWLTKHKVRRYGFHGTNHGYVAGEAARTLNLDPHHHGLITMHLGNGCSCTAIQNGQCVDTTMGLTPLEGVMMGTRSGSLDPAVVTYVAKQTGTTADQVVDALNKRSGILGVSGVSNDLRTVIAEAHAGNQRCALALEMFADRIAKAVAALCTQIDRVDGLVFTGGIGENNAAIRGQIVRQLWFLGLNLDPERNAINGRQTAGRITRDDSACAVVIVPANEELAIARETEQLITHSENRQDAKSAKHAKDD